MDAPVATVQNHLLSCFSTAVSAFRVFSPLELTLSSCITPLECFSSCVLAANRGGGDSAGGMWQRRGDARVLFLGPVGREVCVVKRCLLFAPVESHRTTCAAAYSTWQSSEKDVCFPGTFARLSLYVAVFKQLLWSRAFRLELFSLQAEGAAQPHLRLHLIILLQF